MSVKQLNFAAISRAKYEALQAEIHNETGVMLQGDSGNYTIPNGIAKGLKVAYTFNEAAQSLAVTVDGFFAGNAAGKISALVNSTQA
jgi:hypothetical protein